MGILSAYSVFVNTRTKVMKKFFLAISLCLIALAATPAAADIFPLTSLDQRRPTPRPQSVSAEHNDNWLPNPNDEQAVRTYFKKRFEEVSRSVMDKDTDLNNSVGVDIVHSPEYFKAQEEQNKKGLFQTFYEKALESLGGKLPDSEETAVKQDEQAMKAVAQAAQKFYSFAEEQPVAQPQIPTVGVTLPSGRRILAPAREHIAYFLSYIDIQANGYLTVEDTITLVANNEKFAYGLSRMFPKYAAKYQKIDFMLDSVTVNGTNVPYTAEEIGDNIVIKPKYNQRLEAGVYTYVFRYTVNNKLTTSEQKQFLDWSLTGRPMDILITSANAIISIPSGYDSNLFSGDTKQDAAQASEYGFDDVVALVGRAEAMTQRRTRRFDLSRNVVAFSNVTPMLNGEMMHLLAVMDNSVFIKGFNRDFSHFLTNWGNIFYAFLGLAAILISFVLSLLNLKKDRKKRKYTPSYNGALMRSIMINKYDRVAFVAQILDLFRKNAVDIQQSDNRVYLVKKNLDSAKLTSPERRAVKTLFKKQGNAVEVNNVNNIRFKKAKKILEKVILRQIKKYNIFHNISYVLFSTAMLLITEIFIAFISVNFAQTLIILLATTLMYAFYIWILRHDFKHWYITIPTKVLTLVAMFVIWGFSSIYIGGICSLLIMLMVTVIFAFTGIFAKQNSFAEEAQDAIRQYKEYLTGNAETINLSRNFVNQQSNVFALDISEYFPQNVGNKSYHRLDEAAELKQRLIDIL